MRKIRKYAVLIAAGAFAAYGDAEAATPPASGGTHQDSRSALDPALTRRTLRLVAEQLGLKAGEIRLDARFVDDLGADSLDCVEMVMAIEEEFDIEVQDEDAEKLLTVRQAIEYIARRLAAKRKVVAVVFRRPGYIGFT